MSTYHHHLSDRLIRTIETNADALAQGVVRKLQTSSRTENYHKLAHRDLYNRSYEIYHHLGLWLWDKSDLAIQAQYNQLGERRCEEHIPLAQVLWALVFTKEHLSEYLADCGLVDSAMDLYQHQEFVRLIAHFFDRALCYTAQGYERQASQNQNTLQNRKEEKRVRKSWFPAGLHKNAH